MSRSLTIEALTLSDIIVAKGALFLRESDPSDIAASIVYFARKNILLSLDVSELVKVPSLWPEELAKITRCSEQLIHAFLENPPDNETTVPISPPEPVTGKRLKQKLEKRMTQSAEPKQESNFYFSPLKAGCG